MHIVIHACLRRNDYVYQRLIPSLLAQGIRANEIGVWMDVAGEGNLMSCVHSFQACGLFPGGTWHLQDDVILSRHFAEQVRAYDEGVVCGFCNRDFGPDADAVGIQKAELAWNSFQCLRIPNALAGEFALWFLREARNRQAYLPRFLGGKSDDWFWREFLLEKHPDLEVLNLRPNIVDHIDYLIGGSVINAQRRKPAYRSAWWEDEDLVETLAKETE